MDGEKKKKKKKHTERRSRLRGARGAFPARIKPRLRELNSGHAAAIDFAWPPHHLPESFFRKVRGRGDITSDSKGERGGLVEYRATGCWPPPSKGYVKLIRNGNSIC